MLTGSSFSICSPALVILLFVMGYLTGVNFIVVLICTLLMISKVMHLLIHLLAICVSFLEINLFKNFFPLLVRLFIFCCWIRGVIYVVWIIVPYQMYNLQMFSRFLWVAYYSIVCVFYRCTETWHFGVVQFISFVVDTCAFGIIPKISLPDPMSESFSFFLQRVL